MDDLLIRIHNGLIQGYVQNGVRTWKAIPYAEPPVSERRFRKPVPARPWVGVRSGDMTVPLAPQRVNPTGGAFGLKRDHIPQSEDCLYVNVWAPDGPAPQPLPVMVWIHGGTFVTGGGGLPIYDGSELAHRGGLVVVSLSYRLGPLGFAHLSPYSREEAEDGYVSNAGLLDQIEALRWVKHNIAAFGGDPQQVTVFGESAGSMSIAALLAMPAAQGLFNRAIMQSGASQAISDRQGRLLAKGLLDILGISEQQLERLHEVPAEDILRAADQLRQAAGASAVMLFQPVIDGKSLPVTPLEAVAAGSAAGIDIIIGTNRDEGALFIPEGTKVLTKEQNARAYTAVTGTKEAANWIESYPATVNGQRQAMTELFFWRSALQFAEAQLTHASVWMYRYDYAMVPGDPLLGTAFHSAEIPFVLHNLDLLADAGMPVNDEMSTLAERMQDAWTAFAKKGQPSTPSLPWPAYDAAERSTMVFGADSKIVGDPDAEKRRMLTGGPKQEEV